MKKILFLILIYGFIHTDVFAASEKFELPNCNNIRFNTSWQYLQYVSDKELSDEAWRAGFCNKDIIAITYYTEIIKRNPNDFEAYGGRARAKAHYGDQNGAMMDYKKQLSVVSPLKTPERVAKINWLIGFQYSVDSLSGDKNSENGKLAIKYFTDAIKNQPKYPEAFEWRGRCRVGVGLKTSDIQLINLGIQDIGYAKEQYLELGDIENYKKAIDTYNKHIEYKKEFLQEK